MACLTREKGRYYRLHWKFTVSAGPQAGKLMEGSQYLGRCTRAAAKARLTRTGGLGGGGQGRAAPAQRRLGRRVRALAARKGAQLHAADGAAGKASADAVRAVAQGQESCRASRSSDLACRQDLVRWRDHRLDHEAGRKTVANDLATLSSLFQWCVFEKFLTENPSIASPDPASSTRRKACR